MRIKISNVPRLALPCFLVLLFFSLSHISFHPYYFVHWNEPGARLLLVLVGHTKLLLLLS
ncbi:uncharacterized protein BDV14DRAFT_177795 [Aspergillus stella-maris]|uniref:uncharacterized protein n=1 Tax=Aspergillus stella-maris TaxID=1810926 RepID=UPI003CCD1DA7